MRLYFLNLTIVVALISATADAQLKTDSNVADHYQTKDFNVAIFPASYQFLPGEPFTPSRQDIDKAEFALQKELETIIKRSHRVNHKPGLKGYIRQYFGVKNKNGHRILSIECFLDTNNEFSKRTEWLNYYLNSLEEIYGCHFWEINFDLETEKFSSFLMLDSGCK